jgi:hypothetical protein
MAKFYEFVEENSVIKIYTFKNVACLLRGEFQIPCYVIIEVWK